MTIESAQTSPSVAAAAVTAITSSDVAVANSIKGKSKKNKKKGFIDKSHAVTFQVVHRSQRDPLLADDSVSKLVLKELPPSRNLLKKGKAPQVELNDVPNVEYDDSHFPEGYYEDREDVDEYDFDDDDEDVDVDGEDDEKAWDDEEDGADSSSQVGPSTKKPQADQQPKIIPKKDKKEDPSVYGIFFNDQSEYDYMKHLKVVGEDPNAFLFEARSTAQAKSKSAPQGIGFKDIDAQNEMSATAGRKVQFSLPSETLPSKVEERVGMLSKEATVSVYDVEPEMREIIYALDDEEYVEDELDDFFEALNSEVLPGNLNIVPDGEYVPPPESERSTRSKVQVFNFDEEGEEDPEWYAAYRKYREQKDAGSDEDEHEEDEDEGDEGRTALTGVSMTSSAVFRTHQLTLLDDKFEETLKGYDYDDDEDFDHDPTTLSTTLSNTHLNTTSSNQQQPAIAPDRVEAAFAEFLSATEVVGRHRPTLIKQRLTGQEFDELRRELKDTVDPKGAAGYEMQEASGDALDAKLEDEILADEAARGSKEDRWDAETILTTYSNIYNHPTMIKEISATAPKFRFSRGVPVVERKAPSAKVTVEESDDNDDDDDDDEDEEPAVNKGAARPKSETPEEKKARKAAVKAERKNRRSDKKSLKDAYKQESKVQKKAVASRDKLLENAVSL